MLPPLLLLLVPGLLPSSASLKSHVHRRGLIELAETIDCVGHRTPLAYVSYGCYCGLGGHGQPLDAIDRCCHHHDCCYQRAMDEAGCQGKVKSYSWKCIRQHIECGESPATPTPTSQRDPGASFSTSRGQMSRTLVPV
uniref:Phospholipase A2 n=1 Tax=Molossus molossus TaxID=27622 RepID=A0A7J8J1J0_MOLMO|nr:hypothetical protein HJG59_010376 [Molossus molossus]